MGVMCKYCNKEFSSYQSRCNHVRKFHDNTNNTKSIIDNTFNNTLHDNLSLQSKYKCTNCDKSFNNYQNRWKHKKICKNSESCNKDKLIAELQNKMLKMESQISILLNKEAKIHPKTLQKINKQLHNEGSIGAVGNNNKVIHNTYVKFGDVKLGNLLDEDQILSILNKQFFSLEESIKMIHFNEDLPEYNNIYITNMRDNLAYIFDGSKFISVNKNEVISKLISTHSDELSVAYDDYKNKLNTKTARHVEGFLDLINDVDEYVDINNKTHESYKAYKIADIKRLIYDNSDGKKLAELKKSSLINIQDNEIKV